MIEDSNFIPPQDVQRETQESSEFTTRKEKENKLRFYKVTFKDPNLENSMEGQAVSKIFAGINQIKKLTSRQSENPLSAEYTETEEAERNIKSLVSRTTAIRKILDRTSDIYKTYNSSGTIPDISIQFKIKEKNSEFIEIPISNAEQLQWILKENASIYVHDIRNPITGLWGAVQLIQQYKEKFYKKYSEMANNSIPKINSIIESGASFMINELKKEVNEESEPQKHELSLFRIDNLCKEYITSSLNVARGETGFIESETIEDAKLTENTEVLWSDVWCGRLFGNIAQNTRRAFEARKKREDAGLYDFQNPLTPDDIKYSDIPDDPNMADFSGIPELLKERNKRLFAVRYSLTKDNMVEIRFYDNAIGYKKEIIDKGIIQAKDAHGYDPGIPSEGVGLDAHVKVIREHYGGDIIPSFVRDKNGKVVPNAALTIIKIPAK